MLLPSRSLSIASDDAVDIAPVNLQNVSVIKMDVEGYEMEVIAGGMETILRNKPVLFVEIWRAGIERYEQKVQTIEALGYTSVWLGDDDFLFLPNS